jgi:hypothetical protein
MIVEGFSASLKVAWTAWLVGTPLTPVGVGTVAITEGAVGAGTVKKVQGFATPPDPSGVPARSVAPAAILAVYTVLFASRLDGVKSAPVPLPVQLTDPATVPSGAGAVTVNVVERVEQFIALLNVTPMAWVSRTPVAVFDGMVVDRVGIVSVVNVDTTELAKGVPAAFWTPVVRVAV